MCCDDKKSCRLSIFSLYFLCPLSRSDSTLVIVPKMMANMIEPNIIMKTVVTISRGVTGDMSPYPTVVSVVVDQ